MSDNDSTGSFVLGRATHHGSIKNTMALTRALEDGKISASRYVDLRADVVGKPNLVRGFVLPLLNSFMSRRRRSELAAEEESEKATVEP